MDRNIRIEISGPAGAGKSYLMGLIGQYLDDQGYIVEALEDPANRCSDRVLVPDLPPVVDREISEDTVVRIVTKQ